MNNKNKIGYVLLLREENIEIEAFLNIVKIYEN